MSSIAQALQARGVRLNPLPDLGVVHPEFEIEAPADIAAEIHVYQRFRLGAFSHLNGGFIKDVTIGRYCSFARDVQIGHGFHPVDWLSVSPLQYTPGYRGWMGFVERVRGQPQPCPTRPFNWQAHTTIGHDVWIGNHAVVKDGVQIGTGAVVGANAVVTHDVPPYAIVAGNPARVLRMRFPEAIAERLLATQWWRYSLADFGPLPFDRIETAVELIEAAIAGGLQPYVAPVVGAQELLALARAAR